MAVAVGGIEAQIAGLEGEIVAVVADISATQAALTTTNSAVSQNSSDITKLQEQTQFIKAEVAVSQNGDTEVDTNEMFINSVVRLVDANQNTQIELNNTDKTITVPSNSGSGNGGTRMMNNCFQVLSTESNSEESRLDFDGIYCNTNQGDNISFYTTWHCLVNGLIETYDSFVVRDNYTTNSCVKITNAGSISLINNGSTTVNGLVLAKDGSITFSNINSSAPNYDAKIVIGGNTSSTFYDGMGTINSICNRNVFMNNFNQTKTEAFTSGNSLITSIKTSSSSGTNNDAYVGVYSSGSIYDGDGSYYITAQNVGSQSRFNQSVYTNYVNNSTVQQNFLANGTGGLGSTQQNPTKKNDAYIQVVGGISSSDTFGQMILAAQEIDIQASKINLIGDVYINGILYSPIAATPAQNALTIDAFYDQVDLFQGYNPSFGH